MVVMVRTDGKQVAEPCECRHQMRVSRLLDRARIPPRYENCDLDNYEVGFPGADVSLSHAKFMAGRFIDGYPALTGDRGLLFTGDKGLGKTHLAIGILKALIMEKGVKGLFYDYQDLLKAIQNSYNPQVSTTELQVLNPVFDAEVLVLDDLGRQKSTDWVWDTVTLILNTRYNQKRTTIITTNFSNAPSAGAMSGLEKTVRQESLGDRITDRMRSRLAEMCVEVSVRGRDFRESVNRQQTRDAFTR